MRHTLGLLSLVVFLLHPGQLAAQMEEGPVDGDDQILVVQMLDKSPTEFSFGPTEIIVRRGMTLRFLMTGNVPHNIQFKDPPEGARLGNLMMGPFLIQAGQTYDVVIDDRFVDGLYPVVCTPHELMGMKGTITVVPGP